MDLHYEIEKYDFTLEENLQQWETIKKLKPKEMNELIFQNMIQQARLDNKMISSFDNNNVLQCKNLIYMGANKQYLYDYVSGIGGRKLTMVQGWLLEDLHNIRKEKHYPYVYDREISDIRIINKNEYKTLLDKFEKKEEFSFDEKDCFLLEEYEDGRKMYIAIDNSTSNMWVEEFLEKETAERYLKGENIDKLREEMISEDKASETEEIGEQE
ncbi:hypothetical protein [uncultured Clostridium sp.]|uniref:hypothetical protein n=1 Tax=uncultured Clostridium sp. TaxID=59620 RepID=UPI00272BCF71|nr:hypothetical protein [uncultured Clostridium sp.]